MKKILLGTAALAFSAGMALAQDVVRMGTEGAYPPYNFINDQGEVDGFERELGDELCSRAELTCEWVTNEWDSIIPNLVSGNYDTIIAGMSINDERDEVIDFTQDYIPPATSSYVALSEDADLTGVASGGITGTPASARARAVPPLERSSTPRSARPRANSTTSVLSNTESRARRTVPSAGGSWARLEGGAIMGTPSVVKGEAR